MSSRGLPCPLTSTNLNSMPDPRRQSPTHPPALAQASRRTARMSAPAAPHVAAQVGARVGETPWRFAYFARGLDGLFLPSTPTAEAWAIVRGDSPEEDWIGSIVPRERTIVYQLRGHKNDPYPSTGDVLRDSNVAQELRRRRIGSLVLSSSFTPDVRDWSQRNGMQVIASRFEDQRRLENKIWFDRFLTRHAIRKPESIIVRVAHLVRSAPTGNAVSTGRVGQVVRSGTRVGAAKSPDWLRGPVVVQRADSLGGEGTYFLDSAGEWPELARRLELPVGERLLMRRFITGRSLGITVFVSPGTIALSAVRRQCYFPRSDGVERSTFAGIQWVASDELSSRLRTSIESVFRALGEQLYRSRFVGFANCDFLADADDRVWLIECNPRMSAATPQLLARPELSGGVLTGERLLDAFRLPRRWPAQPVWSPFPETTYRGATLELVCPPSAVVNREPRSGAYRDRAGSYALYSLSKRGQRPTPEATLGIVLADFPLYDGETPNAEAYRLIKKFRYT